MVKLQNCIFARNNSIMTDIWILSLSNGKKKGKKKKRPKTKQKEKHGGKKSDNAIGHKSSSHEQSVSCFISLPRTTWPHHPIFHSKPLTPMLFGLAELFFSCVVEWSYEWSLLVWQDIVSGLC